MKEYNVGIKHEKSALENLWTIMYLKKNQELCHFMITNKRISQLKVFMRNPRNIVKFIDLS